MKIFYLVCLLSCYTAASVAFVSNRVASGISFHDTFCTTLGKVQYKTTSSILLPTTKSMKQMTRINDDNDNVLNLRIPSIIFSLFVVAMAGPSSFYANAAELTKGQAIFDNTCAGCHKGGTNIIAKERTLTEEALKKFLGSVESPDDISNFVRNSSVHRGALVFSGRLTEEDYANVAAYVYDQAMEKKW